LFLVDRTDAFAQCFRCAARAVVAVVARGVLIRRVATLVVKGTGERSATLRVP